MNSNSKLYRLGVQLVTSSNIRRLHQDSRNELGRLKDLLLSRSNEGVTIWFDQRYSAPGFGDLLVGIALANVVSSLGIRVSFFWYSIPDSPSLDEKIKTVSRFLDVSVDKFLMSSEGAESIPGNVLFRTRVLEKDDVSVPAFQLLNLIHQDSLMRRRLSKPLWPEAQGAGPTEKSSAHAVGIHVRNSAESAYRNPKDKDTLKDLIRIQQSFPHSTLIWFGEYTHYVKFVDKNSSILSKLRIKLRFQAASGFADAASEALSCDFWFQRWGGGIGAAIWLSSIPYLMISNDYVLRRLFRVKKRRIVTWAQPNQIYDLRWFMARQRIRRSFLKP